MDTCIDQEAEKGVAARAGQPVFIAGDGYVDGVWYVECVIRRGTGGQSFIWDLSFVRQTDRNGAETIMIHA